MKHLFIIITILLIPTLTQAAPSNLQLYSMWQNQNQIQMMDDMDRGVKARRM